MSKSDAGKGDDSRMVDVPRFRKNHDHINWKSKRKSPTDPRTGRARRGGS